MLLYGGSNASHGIINIVTKEASKSAGTLVSISSETGYLEHLTSIRHGYSKENLALRVYAKESLSRHGKAASGSQQSVPDIVKAGSEIQDAFRHKQSGFRGDYYTSDFTLTFQGDIYENNIQSNKISLGNKISILDTQSSGHNFLSRVESIEKDISLQLYYDHTFFEHNTFEDERKIIDIDFQHLYTFDNSELIWGLGYRSIINNTANKGNFFAFALDPENRNDDVSSFFIQDEFHYLENKLLLTIGSRFEQNAYTGYEYEPNVHFAYLPNEQSTYWGSISRALSIPSRTSEDAYLDINGVADFGAECSDFGGVIDSELGCIDVISKKDEQSVVLLSYELGMRYYWNKYIMDHAFYYNN